MFHSHGFAYVRTGDMLDFIGSLTDRTGFTVITADMNRNVLAVSKDLEGLMLTEDYPVLDLYMQQGHYDAVFDGYFAALGVHPRQTEKLRGYTSWYNYYSNINHNIIMHDLRAIAPCAGVNTFQVDDGYQTAVGDWLSVDSKKFPFGMRRVADAVHQRRDRRGKKQEPKENHRRQKTHGTLLALGKFTADDVGHRSHDIAEAHDKEPHQHRCQQSFVHSPFRHSTSFNIHYLVKVKFFSRNTQRKPCIFLSGIPVFRQKKHCYSPFFAIFDIVLDRMRLGKLGTSSRFLSAFTIFAL